MHLSMSPTCRSDALNESRKSSAAATRKQEREKNFRLRLPAWPLLQAPRCGQSTLAQSPRGEELRLAECGSGGGPQVWTYSAECASKMRDEQDSLDLALFIGIDWSNMHNKRSQRSICNISRFTSCGLNNLGGKWVMTVALGPDTLTMFDECPKGWGDDHLNDHTTERNTMESLVRKISNPNSGCQSVSLETT